MNLSLNRNRLTENKLGAAAGKEGWGKGGEGKEWGEGGGGGEGGRGKDGLGVWH